MSDTVDGFIAALQSNAGVGQFINLGSNFEISIGDTALAIAQAMGVELSILTDEYRLRPEKSEVERLWASNLKALGLLNWQPKYAGSKGFFRGLNKTIAWFSDPQNLSNYRSDVYNV